MTIASIKLMEELVGVGIAEVDCKTNVLPTWPSLTHIKSTRGHPCNSKCTRYEKLLERKSIAEQLAGFE